MWGHDPRIQADVAQYDALFGIPAADINVYAQSSLDGNFHAANTIPAPYLPLDASDPREGGSNFEISLDVEWAHALAPGAVIDLVEAQDGTIGNVSSAIAFAQDLPNVSVVSMSFGIAENIGHYPDALFMNPHVTFVAGSGDSGSYSRPTPDTFQPDPFSTTVNGQLGGYNDTASLIAPAKEQSLSDDFTVVTFVRDDTTASQTGIDIRVGNASNAANVALLANSINGGTFEYRATNTNGTNTSSISEPTATIGSFLALQRSGDSFFGYTSVDGFTWVPAGSITLTSMAGTVSVYLAGGGAGGVARAGGGESAGAGDGGGGAKGWEGGWTACF